MVIRKQPVMSWLLEPEYKRDLRTLGHPLLQDIELSFFLKDAFDKLEDIRNAKLADWGLPYVIMPSFEKAMKKSAASFIKIDHQLFEDFSKEGECGIIVDKDAAIVYGFSELTLHVWLFFTSDKGSSLHAYYNVESLISNVRRLNTHQRMMSNDELYTVPREERDDFFDSLTNRIVLFCAVKKYAIVDTIIVPTGQVLKISEEILPYKEKVKNDSGQEVILMDSRWFTRIINDNDIFVRGFFRLQNKKNAAGEWYKELIFVDSFIRHGYHRNAQMDEDIPDISNK